MNRRHVNLKFVLGLLIAVGVTGAGVHFVHGYQVKRQAGILLRRAADARESQDFAKAIDYLGRYLGFEPGNNDALADYAELLDEEGARTGSVRLRVRAFSAQEQVLLREPDRHAVRWRQVDVGLALGTLTGDVGYVTSAAAHAETLLQNDPSLDDAKLARLEQRLGRADTLRKRYPEAVGWYEKAAAHAPADVENHMVRALLLRLQLDEAEKADAIVEEMIGKIQKAVAPEDEKKVLLLAHLERGRYSIRFFPGEAGERRNTLKEMAEKDVAEVQAGAEAGTPEEVQGFLAAAELAQAKEDRPGAKKILAEGLKKQPKSVALGSALANLEAGDGQIQTALDLIVQMLEENPDRIDLLYNLAELRVQEAARKKWPRWSPNSGKSSSTRFGWTTWRHAFTSCAGNGDRPGASWSRSAAAGRCAADGGAGELPAGAVLRAPGQSRSGLARLPASASSSFPPLSRFAGRWGRRCWRWAVSTRR